MQFALYQSLPIFRTADTYTLQWKNVYVIRDWQMDNIDFKILM